MIKSYNGYRTKCRYKVDIARNKR